MYPYRPDLSPPSLAVVGPDLIAAAAAIRAGKIDIAEDARAVTAAQCYLLGTFLAPGTTPPGPLKGKAAAQPLSREAAAAHLETLGKSKVVSGTGAFPWVTVLGILADLLKAFAAANGG